MFKRIPFIDKLRNHIDILLEKNGFELKHLQNQPFEAIGYERPLPSFTRPDMISFHGLEPDYGHNYIDCIAVAGKTELAWLPLRSLADNYTELKYPDLERWTYDTEEELEVILQEITHLLKHRLLEWFENPVMPLIEPPPISDRIATLKQQIELCDEISRNLYAEGDLEGAKRFEEAVKRYRKHLEQLG